MSHRLPALSAALLLLAAACSVETTPEDDDVTAIQDALELDDGGMTMDAEAPAFGDEEQFTAIDDFAEVADATPVEVAAGLDRYRVVLIWGSLARGETPASPTDWSGDLSLDQGAMRVTRTLVFDSQDGLLPREDAQTVSFVSHTLPHVDGLALDLVAPPGASLSFTTAPLTATIRLADLAAAGR
ncbi:MAG: hypothetical protein KC731_10910, partial [Myxococcales bacterium]|nr:hypothetical protein [Myxococcales bacterium]